MLAHKTVPLLPLPPPQLAFHSSSLSVYTSRHQHKDLQEAIHHQLILLHIPQASQAQRDSFPAMYMAQEEAGLALGLSLGSGATHQHLLQQKEAAPLEPYLALSLAGAGTVKREREEKERSLIYCSAASSAADDQVEGYNSSSGGGGRKKLRLTKEQTSLLEDHFREQSTLSHKQKSSLARQLNLRQRQVEVWFQNRRARTKLKQTEVDCDLLKRCCETLTEENRRLHRELQHLRALHHHHHHPAAAFFMPAAATASVCPSCIGAPPAHVADRPTTKRSFLATKSAAC